ncbi:MAG: YgjP-like metallopeptidase domain-containing protein [Candidatus Aenigmatarchaeota archaeon]
MKKLFKPLKVISKVGNKRITYFVIKREIKYPRLEFKNNLLYLIIPKNFKDFKSLIKKREKWILKKQELINKFLEKGKGTSNKFILFGTPIELNNFRLKFLNGAENSERIKNVLKQMLFQKIKPIVENYSQKLGINYNKILIRNQKTKWASCSSKKNLSFNIKMLSLPESLINYLVFHEMLHLIEKNHNEKFISLIKKEFPNCDKMEEELTKYWFVLNNNYWWNKLS